jgi:hypothetical protein
VYELLKDMAFLWEQHFCGCCSTCCTQTTPQAHSNTLQKRKTYIEGHKVETTRSPPESVDPPCQFASICGGCTLQSLPYKQQTAAKEDRLQFELNRIACIEDVRAVMRPLVVAAQPFRCAFLAVVVGSLPLERALRLVEPDIQVAIRSESYADVLFTTPCSS